MRFGNIIPRVRSAATRRMRQAVGLKVTGRAAFSQEGEDLVVARLLGVAEGKSCGFYIDVGAHHPEKYSNTLFFYELGWRGINIDPAPGSAQKFNAARPRDINVEIAISDTPGEIEYVMFNEPALNGCDRHLAKTRDGKNGHHIDRVVHVKTRRIDNLLDEHMPSGTPIDFLSVDVEGHDLAVLKSNDWDRYRPHLILAEDMAVGTLADVEGAPITSLLRDAGYVAVSKCALTIIYAESSRVCQTELGVRVR